jgi:hypothetical protein
MTFFHLSFHPSIRQRQRQTEDAMQCPIPSAHASPCAHRKIISRRPAHQQKVPYLQHTSKVRTQSRSLAPINHDFPTALRLEWNRFFPAHDATVRRLSRLHLLRRSRLVVHLDSMQRHKRLRLALRDARRCLGCRCVSRVTRSGCWRRGQRRRLLVRLSIGTVRRWRQGGRAWCRWLDLYHRIVSMRMIYSRGWICLPLLASKKRTKRSSCPLITTPSTPSLLPVAPAPTSSASRPRAASNAGPDARVHRTVVSLETLHLTQHLSRPGIEDVHRGVRVADNKSVSRRR